MQKTTKTGILVGLSLLLVVGIAFDAQASAGGHDGFVSLLNPYNPATLAVEKVVERTLPMGTRLPHAGMSNNFSSMAFFSDYDFGSSNDKRAGGFNNYTKSLTVGGDAVYKDSMLVGAIFNYTDSVGHNAAGAKDQLYAQTFTLYAAQSLSEYMSWGTSFSFSDSESRVGAAKTDTDSWVVAPYVSFMKQCDNVTLSLSPSYILGYQKADYSTAGVGDDEALAGRLVLMSRAAVAVSEKMSLSASLNFNQVLHNHGLDSETDNDHNWFTYGVKMDYTLSENVGIALGYNSEFDSDFDSDMWLASVSYVF